MSCIEELREISKNNGGIIETETAAEMGISRAMLSKLCKENRLCRIAHGQYVFSDDMADELLSIARRSEKIVFSHETALYLHGLSDRIPFVHSVTVPTGYVPSEGLKEVCRVYYIKPELFDLGKTVMKSPAGNGIFVYDLERTVCDAVRSRNRIGTGTFFAALKLYADRPGKDLNRLNGYARKLRVSNVLRGYLEVLL